MNNPYSAQERQAMQVETPQNIEAWALLQLAHRLNQARQNIDGQENLRDTVRLNWRIWTIFQAELLKPDSPTSKEIRENLLSLSNFIDKRSLEIIGITKDIPAEKIDVLININRHIGNGLLGNKAEDADIPDEDMVEKISQNAPDKKTPPSNANQEKRNTQTDIKI